MAIVPSEGALYAPVDGEVTMLFETNHALGMKNGPRR
ncbi:PTS glucose transporter subunit IIA [Bacillus sp. SL00103]